MLQNKLWFIRFCGLGRHVSIFTIVLSVFTTIRSLHLRVLAECSLPSFWSLPIGSHLAIVLWSNVPIDIIDLFKCARVLNVLRMIIIRIVVDPIVDICHFWKLCHDSTWHLRAALKPALKLVFAFILNFAWLTHLNLLIFGRSLGGCCILLMLSSTLLL